MNLNSYNQRLIAVFGTLALVALAGVFVLGAIKIIYNSFGGRNNEDTSLRINSEPGSDEKVPVQTVSFLMPVLIDSINKIYLVPVSQLNEPKLDKDDESIYDYSGYGGGRYYKKYKFSGSYNNIIVFDERSGSKTAIFKEKIHISYFQNELISSKFKILTIKGARQDTNKDGKLNADDLESFFVYNLSNQTLKEYREEGMGLSDYQILFESNKIALSFIKDLNKSGEIDFTEEPQLLKILDLDTGLLQDFADDQMLKLLNQTIN